MGFAASQRLKCVKASHPGHVGPHVILPTLRLQEHECGGQAAASYSAGALAAFPIADMDVSALLALLERLTQDDVTLEVVDIGQ